MSIRLEMLYALSWNKNINEFNPLFSKCVMHKCWTNFRRVKEIRKIRATLPDDKNRNHAKGAYIIFDYVYGMVCVIVQIKKKRPCLLQKCRKYPWKIIHFGCLYEWVNTFVYMLLLLLLPAASAVFTLYTGCTHFEFSYFPVLFVCVCVPSIHPTHSIFGSWNIQSSLCTHHVTFILNRYYRSIADISMATAFHCISTVFLFWLAS